MGDGYEYSASTKGRRVVGSGGTLPGYPRGTVLLALSIERDPERTQARTDAHLALSRSDYASARCHTALPYTSAEYARSILALAAM